MLKIFLCEPIHPRALALLKTRAEVFSDPACLGRADAAISRNLRMDAAFLEQCPALKVIGIHGTGTDRVDLAAAAQRGVRVVYAPGENAQSVAELIVGLTLALARRVYLADRMLQTGEALAIADARLTGMELHGKTLGLVGVGSIARWCRGDVPPCVRHEHCRVFAFSDRGTRGMPGYSPLHLCTRGICPGGRCEHRRTPHASDARACRYDGACRGKARRAARQYGAGRRGGRGCIVPRSDAGSSGSCCLRCARPRAARARPAAAAFAQLSGDAASRCSHGRSAAACWHVRCGADLHRAGRQNARS